MKPPASSRTPGTRSKRTGSASATRCGTTARWARRRPAAPSPSTSGPSDPRLRLDGMRYYGRHASAVLVLVWLPVRVPDGRPPDLALTEATRFDGNPGPDGPGASL